MEVADTSLRLDRGAKASLYASAGIPEYWILNLGQRELERHTRPVADETQPFKLRYATVESLGEKDELAPAGMSAKIRVVDLLPARR